MAKVDGTGSQSEAEVSGVAGQGETGEASHPTDALVSADGGDIAVAAGAEAVPRAEAAESTAAEGGAATGRPGWPLGQALRRVWRGLRQRGAWARKAVLGVRGQRGRNAVADAVVVEETDSRVGPAASEVEVLGGNSALAQHHGDRRSPAGTAQGRADAARAAGVGPPRAGRGGGHGWGSARARRVPAGFDARRLLGGLVAVPEELVVREESKSMHEEAFRIANLVDLGGPEGAPTESGMERGGGAPQSDGVGMAPKRALAHVDSMGGPDGVDDAWGATRGWHRSENGTAGRSLRILEGVPEGGTPEGPLFTMASDSARPRRFFNDSAKTRSRPSGPGIGSVWEGDVEALEELVSSTTQEAAQLATLSSFKANGRERQHLVARRGPGTLVGETAVMGRRGVRTCSVRAAGPVQVVCIEGAVFRALLASVPGLEVQLKQMVAQRKAIRRMVEAVQQLGQIHWRAKAAGRARGVDAEGVRPRPQKYLSESSGAVQRRGTRTPAMVGQGGDAPRIRRTHTTPG